MTDIYREDQATVTVDQANIAQLNALEAFKLVRAPFDGTVTARDTDIGAYVTFDIGTKVKAGAVLAEIDTPEVDQQLAQAEAQLKVAQAARDLAQVSYQRRQVLFN